MFKILLGTLVAVPVGAYFYHGFDKYYPAIESKIPNQTFLYTQYVGSYSKIGGTFRTIESDTKELRTKLGNIRYGTMYYDDPMEVADKAACRAVAGIFFDPKVDKAAALEFLKTKPGYDVKEIPETPCVKTNAPFKSPLTFIWLSISIYPKLFEYLKVNHMTNKNDKKLILEIYDEPSKPNAKVDVQIPYGPNLPEFWLSKAPEPALAAKKK